MMRGGAMSKGRREMEEGSMGQGLCTVGGWEGKRFSAEAPLGTASRGVGMTSSTRLLSGVRPAGVVALPGGTSREVENFRSRRDIPKGLFSYSGLLWWGSAKSMCTSVRRTVGDSEGPVESIEAPSSPHVWFDRPDTFKMDAGGVLLGDHRFWRLARSAAVYAARERASGGATMGALGVDGLLWATSSAGTVNMLLIEAGRMARMPSNMDDKDAEGASAGGSE